MKQRGSAALTGSTFGRVFWAVAFVLLVACGAQSAFQVGAWPLIANTGPNASYDTLLASATGVGNAGSRLRAVLALASAQETVSIVMPADQDDAHLIMGIVGSESAPRPFYVRMLVPGESVDATDPSLLKSKLVFFVDCEPANGSAARALVPHIAVSVR